MATAIPLAFQADELKVAIAKRRRGDPLTPRDRKVLIARAMELTEEMPEGADQVPEGMVNDAVVDALRAPIVQAMAPDRRAALEQDLRAMAARDVPEAMLRETIAHRLRQEEAEIDDDLTEEEEEELLIETVMADAHPEDCITWEQYCASRGIRRAAAAG